MNQVKLWKILLGAILGIKVNFWELLQQWLLVFQCFLGSSLLFQSRHLTSKRDKNYYTFTLWCPVYTMQENINSSFDHFFPQVNLIDCMVLIVQSPKWLNYLASQSLYTKKIIILHNYVSSQLPLSLFITNSNEMLKWVLSILLDTIPSKKNTWY